VLGLPSNGIDRTREKTHEWIACGAIGRLDGVIVDGDIGNGNIGNCDIGNCNIGNCNGG